MSKYTTQVRFICETEAGLFESTGASNVDQVLNGSWNKIFTTKAPIFEESHRAELCKKILKHYYLREIGCETTGIWKLWMNTRFDEIMPYYNQLYKSETLEFEPFEDVNRKTTHEKNNQGTSNDTADSTFDSTVKDTETNTTDQTINTTQNTDQNTTDNLNRWDKFADTPQGGLEGVESGEYLTDARNITEDRSGNTTTDVTGKQTGNTEYTGEQNETRNDVGHNENDRQYRDQEDFDELVKGKQGSASYSQMLEEYRKTFLNIDMMIIREFEDLFLQLW